MKENSVLMQQTIQDAKRVLILLHQHLPLSLAFWSSAVVSLLKQSGKQVTVLVSEELGGWGQRVDSVYPMDMVLSLDQLRQVVMIPFAGEDAGVSDVTYDVVDEKLRITVIPTGGTLDVDAMQIQEHGLHYDLVLGIGVSASHPLIGLLSQYKPSLSGATGLMVGTVALPAVFSEKMPFLKKVMTLEKLTIGNLIDTVCTASQEATTSEQSREVITLLAQQALKYSEGDVVTQGKILEQVKMLVGSVNGMRMGNVYMSDFAKQNRVLQQLLASAQKASEKSLVMYSLSTDQLTKLDARLTDIIATMFYLPRFFPDEMRIVCIAEGPQQHQVFFEGNPDVAHKLAVRFGFAVCEMNACGVVTGINAEKLQEDLLRISGSVQLEPVSITGIPVPQPIVSEIMPVLSQEKASFEDDSVVATLPVQQHEYAEEELDSGEIIDTAAPELAEMQESQPDVSDSSMQPAPEPPVTSEIPTSSGIDFAAIAKKMRESIT
jgi:hypothetical protein